MEQKKEAIRVAEEKHLKSCIAVIEKNIERLTVEVAQMKAETKEMYDNYRSGDSQVHNELVIGLDLQDKAEHTLYKNLQAEQKAYFGRIDYEEEYHAGLAKKEGEGNLKFSLYIGKNGIMQSTSDILIVDWRAPVASVYYDSDIGKSHYSAPTGEEIQIDLQLKRTFELERDKLYDFYDTDVITNDEFLTKYLAKNKEVVLGEIIATIQKEQNLIIRDTPWHTVIVQGVAGSGKTTVAMHRISYILYNFKDKFKPQEFYVIGSNHMLLNHITSVLPSLDVQGINQMTLEELLLKFLEGSFEVELPGQEETGKKPAGKRTKKSKSYRLIDSFRRTEREILQLKGSLDFMLALEYYLAEEERRLLPHLPDGILEYDGRILYRQEDLEEFLQTFSCFQTSSGTIKAGGVSAEEKIDMLNQRILKKVKMICEMADEEREVIKRETAKVRGFFGKAKNRWVVTEVYGAFLEALQKEREWFCQKGLQLPPDSVLIQIEEEFLSKQADLYDMAALLLIKKRMKWCDDLDLVSHVVVDEAQDFGVSVFYSLHQSFPTATFTIMGDVSQNIYYDSGMNDWVDLRERVFSTEKDRFYRLVKSYRNTVEISHFAGKLLEKGSFETYAIDPVIRHGREAAVIEKADTKALAKEAVKLIKELLERGFSTIAIIGRDEEECRRISLKLHSELSEKSGKAATLSEGITIHEITEQTEEVNSLTGILLLPIRMIKGLEFDAVLLWNPSEQHYPACDANVKLLYVAVTRALHELYLLVDQKEGLCELLQV